MRRADGRGNRPVTASGCKLGDSPPSSRCTPPLIIVRWSSFALHAAGAGVLVLVGDELLKAFVRAHLAVCNLNQFVLCPRVDLVGPLRLVRAENAGSALGYAQGWGLWVALAALGLCLIPMYAHYLRAFGSLAAVAAGLQLGGASGNLLDRVAFGGATDMLTFANAALVWNVADMGLAIGTLLASSLLVRRVVSEPSPSGAHILDQAQ